VVALGGALSRLCAVHHRRHYHYLHVDADLRPPARHARLFTGRVVMLTGFMLAILRWRPGRGAHQVSGDMGILLAFMFVVEHGWRVGVNCRHRLIYHAEEESANTAAVQSPTRCKKVWRSDVAAGPFLEPAMRLTSSRLPMLSHAQPFRCPGLCENARASIASPQTPGVRWGVRHAQRAETIAKKLRCLTGSVTTKSVLLNQQDTQQEASASLGT